MSLSQVKIYWVAGALGIAMWIHGLFQLTWMQAGFLGGVTGFVLALLIYIAALLEEMRRKS